ncbi:MAG: amidohydrolase family protein, partial [Planctomycetia bacterium]
MLISILISFMALHAEPVTLLQPDRVFDGVSSIHEGWLVAIQGEKIIFAGPKTGFKPPTSSQVINLPGTTLTPGLIDAHSHLLLHPYDEAK